MKNYLKAINKSTIRLFLRFWKWPKALIKLSQIREISSKYYNDSKFKMITNIIDK